MPSREGKEKTFESHFEIKHETDNAILVSDGNETMWIPLSQVHEIHRDPDGKSGRIVMTEWIAKKKGLV